MERMDELGADRDADGLSPTEVLLFAALRSKPGRILSRKELLEAMHGASLGNVHEHAVDATVSRLRKALGPRGDCIETVRHAGFRWNPDCVRVDPSTGETWVGGMRIDLSGRESELLSKLAARPGRTFSRKELASGEERTDSASSRAVDMTVVSIRRKLGAARACVETVHGRGYRFRTRRTASAWRIAAAGGALLALLAVVGLALVVADGRGTARTEASLVPEEAGTSVPLTEAEAVEIAKRETDDLFYDRTAAPAVEFGNSVCKVTFWFPPDPELPGQTFAAATVWIDVETKAVVQIEVVED